MTAHEMEVNILEKVAIEMSEADNISTVNKIYRQARNWARYHCYFAKACTAERCTELNRSFKLYRAEALKNLQ